MTSAFYENLKTPIGSFGRSVPERSEIAAQRTGNKGFTGTYTLNKSRKQSEDAQVTHRQAHLPTRHNVIETP